MNGLSRVAGLCRAFARLRQSVAVVLLLTSGCVPTLMLMDQNAYQTGKVLDKGKVRASANTIVYLPLRGALDYGLGRGWQLGGGFGCQFDWGWSGQINLTRRLYSSRHLFGSALCEVELAGGVAPQPPLVRATMAVAGSYYLVDWFGVYLPLRLSMVLAPEAVFPYLKAEYDTTNHQYLYETWYRHFNGLHNIVVTPGIGLSVEKGRFFARYALNLPVCGPYVETDSVTMGIEVWGYLGFQVGVEF